jgi:hypothetical protein
MNGCDHQHREATSEALAAEWLVTNGGYCCIITFGMHAMRSILFDNIREMRDEDLANAIRFAVDHGARIISMSFGKTFSLHKPAVDEAVRYAMSRNVLLVHSAGNNGMDLDAAGNSFYPSPKYTGGELAQSWITVGASGYTDDGNLAATFSNYGHMSVDVFAPGVQLTSILPHRGWPPGTVPAKPHH